MAAGLGFKTFTTGEVLTAGDTNGYLMQGILVFASAAARDAAITSPQEGQTCYLKDTDTVLIYSGSAWSTLSSIGAWTNYSPTITAGSGSYTTASANGSYIRVGKLCVLRLYGLITTVGTGTNPVFTLPFTAATTTAGGKFIGSVRENAATGLSGTASINSAATTLTIFKYDNGAFAGSGYEYSITISYEVA
jgi:hypothetical protein